MEATAITATCLTCATTEALNTLTDGTSMCCSCWNASVYERRAARKAELAALPRCESCTKGPQTWNVAGVMLCGRCKTRATNGAARSVPAHLRGLAMFAPTNPSRETILNLARKA